MDLVPTKFREYKHLQEIGTNDDKTPTASSVEQVCRILVVMRSFLVTIVACLSVVIILLFQSS